MIGERSLVTGLVRALKAGLPGFVVIKHHDPITAGVPDISVTGRKLTTWLEVKYANPRVLYRAVQARTMEQLAAAGRAYYVVYRTAPQVIQILDPRDKDPRKPIFMVGGHDHQDVVRFIEELHA